MPRTVVFKTVLSDADYALLAQEARWRGVNRARVAADLLGRALDRRRAELAQSSVDGAELVEV